MESERTIIKYRGNQLVVGRHGEGYRGVAWGAPGTGKLASADGPTIERVLDDLRQALDSPENLERIKAAIVGRHGEFLQERGIDPTCLSVQRAQFTDSRAERKAHCWNCKASLDSQSDLECTGCKWLICTKCGACGHGHPVFGVKYKTTKSLPGYSDLSLKKFARFEDAKEFASREPGALLRCAEDGNGWDVLLTVEPRHRKNL